MESGITRREFLKIGAAGVEVILRPDFKPSRVYLAPEEQELPFQMDDSEVKATLPRIGGHTILVLEPR